jgi:toxin ParE1/3/4
MKVVLTEAACADMLSMRRFMMKDSPLRPETFVSELFESCQKLEFMHRSYPILPGREESGIGRKAHRNYLIFF